ncbi:hypothetical protein Tco_0833019 [Tanacetum coccineum]
MWPEGIGPTLSGNAASALNAADAQYVRHLARQWASLGHWLSDSSGTSCVPGNGRHLAIGSRTHPGRLAFWVIGVTWQLALRVIRDVLRSG